MIAESLIKSVCSDRKTTNVLMAFLMAVNAYIVLTDLNNYAHEELVQGIGIVIIGEGIAFSVYLLINKWTKALALRNGNHWTEITAALYLLFNYALFFAVTYVDRVILLKCIEGFTSTYCYRVACPPETLLIAAGVFFAITVLIIAIMFVESSFRNKHTE